MSSINDIFSDALMLPNDARADLAKQLLRSLEHTTDLNAEWWSEIERRADEIDKGVVHARDIKDVISEIRMSLGQKTGK